MPISAIPQQRTPTMQSGRLRHKIDIVQVSTVQDSTGGINLSVDTIYANVWASIEALSGTDKFAAHEFVSQVSHQVVIRWIGAAPSWLPNTAYLAGTLVVDANKNLQQAQTPGGITAVAAPTWNNTVGSFTDDGTPSTPFQWKCLTIPAPYGTGVKAKMQVWYQQRQFQIEAVLNPDERNKMLVMLCIEINDSAQQSPNIPTGLD